MAGRGKTFCIELGQSKEAECIVTAVEADENDVLWHFDQLPTFSLIRDNQYLTDLQGEPSSIPSGVIRCFVATLIPHDDRQSVIH